jgi:signal peptidase
MSAVDAAPVPAAAGTGRRRLVGQHIVGRLTRAAGTLVVVLAALVLLAMTVGPRVLHYRTATMLTGSMVPAIEPGDVIVDVEERASDIAVGQLVTYHIPVDDHRVESHRVTWVRHTGDGGVLFRTKGDANAAADPWTARAVGDHVWRVRAVVPLAGEVIRFLRRPAVNMLIARVLPLTLLAWALVSIWRPRRADDPE